MIANLILILINMNKKIEYPFKLASKIIINNSLSHDEACEFTLKTQRLYEICKEQQEKIFHLEQALKIAERTIQLLQISED